MAQGKLRYTAKWHTTSPQQLVREQKEREASQAFVPTVRRRDGRIQKIPAAPVAAPEQRGSK